MPRIFGEGETEYKGVNVAEIETDRIQVAYNLSADVDGETYPKKISFRYKGAVYRDIAISNVRNRTAKNYAGRPLIEHDCEIYLLDRIYRIKLYLYGDYRCEIAIQK